MKLAQTMPEAGSLLPRVEEIMRLTGEYLLSVQLEVEAEGKSDGTPVSRADREAERLLRAGLADALPDALFRGEESEWRDWPEDALCWVVDPLDGTKEYLSKGRGWAVSVALLRGPRPLLGAIYVPATGEMFSTVAGKGAYRGRERLRVDPKIRDAVTTNSMAQKVSAALRQQVRPVFAVALLCIEVASGRAAAYVSVGRSPGPWDIAAGLLLVEEAGGRCTDLEGNALDIDTPETKLPRFLFSNGTVHEHVLRSLEDFRR